MSRLLPSLPDATPEDREPRVVGVNEDDADELIAALGSETAREILTRLHDEPATKSELADAVDTTLQNVQYHLSKLNRADLVDVVDTTYSEKGREMDVYAAADEPLVLFAGGSEESNGIKSALMRLLGGYGIIGLAAVAAQRVLSVPRPTARVSRSTGGGAGGDAATEDAADGPSIETVSEADGGGSGEIDGTVEYVVDPLADYAVSLLEPGSSSSSVPRSCSRSAGRTGTGAAADGARCRHTVPIASGCAHVGQLFMPPPPRSGMEHEAEVVGVGAGSAPGGDVPAVILSARGEYVPIFVSADQAQSIGMALEGEPFDRPLTHDLLVDILTEFGGAIDRVRVDDLRDGTFYAKVDAERYENGEPERFVFDARPSDALAIAVRIDCPIIVSDAVIDEAGRPQDSIRFDDGPQGGA